MAVRRSRFVPGRVGSLENPRPQHIKFSIVLTPALEAQLDRLAVEQTVSRAAIIRQALQAFFVARGVTLPKQDVEVA